MESWYKSMAIRKKGMKTLLLLLPTLAFLTGLYLYPLSHMLLLSFFDPGFTLRHYLHIFEVPTYLQVYIVTLKISAIVTLVSLLLGYPIAYLLASMPPRITNLLIVLVIVPFWTSYLVRTYAWMVLLGRNGIINNLLIWLGAVSSPLKLTYNLFGVSVAMIHMLLPFAILPMYSVMKGIDRNLLKAAQNLGASPIRSFVKVYLPLSIPGVGASVLLTFILALGFFITPALMGGLREVMISMLIETQVSELLNWGFASALATILLVFTLIIFFLFKRFLGFERMAGGTIS
jgi:putative spermidine/putrescine transport system permease protein